VVEVVGLHVVSFADRRNALDLERLQVQAEGMNCFDTIHILTENDLDDDFRRRHFDLLRPTVRGFGFWVWKPQVILQTLAVVPRGDVVLYVDAGCHLNHGGLDRLNEYYQAAQKSPEGLVAFQARKPDPQFPHDGRRLPEFLDAHWTKGDAIVQLGVRNRPDILETPMVMAGVLLVRRGSPGEELVREWHSTMVANTQLIDDTPSASPNLAGFRDHRHDQSIFSLLHKLRGYPTLSVFECWYPLPSGQGPDWDALRDYPIHVKRDLRFRSIESPSIQSLLKRWSHRVVRSCGGFLKHCLRRPKH
jgi:hypothetical protein